jgi:hypothetical protein
MRIDDIHDCLLQLGLMVGMVFLIGLLNLVLWSWWLNQPRVDAPQTSLYKSSENFQKEVNQIHMN